jgi:multidrug efflux pump subunit AcrA (membrane-fusion protein)
VVAFGQGGCAFVPKTNLRLDEARNMHRLAATDARVAELAPAELRRASETLEQATVAWNTLDDPAVVDHLAYLAKQRLAIAQEAAKRSQAEAALTAARSEHNLLRVTRSFAGAAEPNRGTLPPPWASR